MKTKVVLTFSPEASNQPITHNLIAEHHLLVNILRAEIDEVGGKMVLELSGKADDIRKGIDYLKDNSVSVRPIKEGVRRDDDACTHCGMCISICPTKALSIDQKSGKVSFNEEKCVACGVCIDACPPRAMEILI
ncbi:MAG: 4Fe-4S binding protein [Thermoplasmata archaeon]|nr:4Fe-4S binding protein [Thermoplasmata archaeon]MCJ7561910.1 4Fe-4S binding protein [Thermoplasmata archaeon]TFG70716.1 MAG: 4Fe-4S dicluster domain-containing protein [Methanomassiliicoccus sp.]